VEALAHQDAPFQKVIETLRPRREGRYAPLTNVGFAFNVGLSSRLHLPGLAVTPLPIHDGTAKLDLILSVHDGEEGFECNLEYATDVFDRPAITDMLRYFARVLQTVATNPERRLSQLQLPERPPRAESSQDAGSNLTRNQLLIWLDQKLHPDVPLYNVVDTYRLTGELDRGHFERAFQTLLGSSDALRTVIREVGAIPRQEVLADFRCELEHLDFSRAADPRAEFEAWLQIRCRALFKMDKRLFDSALVKVSDREFVWYLNQHHIITDGWSCRLIFRRMSELYARSLEGRLAPTVELPAFGDYVAYEREQQSSPRHLEAEAYWKRKLADKAEPLTFFGRSPVRRTSRVQRMSCELGVVRTERLRRLARREEIAAPSEHASTFNAFAALLFAFLYRTTGNHRLSIGAPFHNRRTEAFKETLGLFMEVLPLRMTVEPTDTFLSLIRKTRAEAAESYRYSLATSNPIGNRAYDVLLNYHTAPLSEFPGMSVHAEWVYTGHENDALALQVSDFNASGSLALDFDFHCDVFDEAERTRTIQQFLRLLDAFLQDPTQPVGEISLLTKEEKERILVDFNRTQCAFSEYPVLPSLFEGEVERAPDAPAVVFEDRSLTYAELNARANRLAHYLASLGVGPDAIVAIYMERSLEMVVALLGVLKAGGAYLPLDPANPDDRLAFMLNDSRPLLVLTQQTLESQLAEMSLGGTPHSTVICLDRHWKTIVLQSDENPERQTTPENLAYVIYTSGSTGKPKGVMISHRGICNRLLWGRGFYQLTGADRVLHAMSPSFDFAGWEILTALTAGAQLILAHPQKDRDTAYLVRLIAEQNITVAGFVPSMLEALLQEPGIETCHSLRKLMSGAEALSGSLQDLFHARLDAELQNTYGPTEAAIDVTFWVCKRAAEYGDNRPSVPIGRPIANTQLYILDSQLQPVPIGAPGELHIGGAGLARGYLNRPDLTVEKFIPNPFSAEPGSRLYKTGDLARYLSDGEIDFLGRIDHQVKIRGFRIELGEIELVLRQHPGVDDAVVVAWEEGENPKSDESGNRKSKIQNPKSGKRLVAYLVSKEESRPMVSELRGFLKQKLPEYMIPSLFVFLEALPRTSNGKVNRRALPAPEQNRPEKENAFVPPSTIVEKTIAEIWAQVLKVDRTGIHDDFFESGGHSLLAIQIVSRLRDVFQIDLPLRSLFENPTIAGLAALVAQAPEPTERVLAELESLSDEQAQLLLAQESSKAT
jgi:amino acid adenylation domain-containing protein